MINVEAAFVILSNATDPELCNALQQNSGLRRRIQRILEHGPPPGSNARLRQQAAPPQRTAQQTPQGWPDTPGPAMTSMPSTPSAQFGGSSHAPHSSARSWADMSEQSDRQGNAEWSRDPWDEPAQHSTDPWEPEAPRSCAAVLARQRLPRQSTAKLEQWQARQRQMGQRRLDCGELIDSAMARTAPGAARGRACAATRWGAHPYYLNAKSNTWLCAFQCTQTRCPHGRPPACNYKPSVIAQDVRSPRICSLCKAEQRSQREGKGQWG